MNSTLQKDILTETYEDMAGLVNHIAHKFWYRFGGDFEEIQAQAMFIFVEQAPKHDPSKKAKLTTWLYQQIMGRLRNWQRQQWGSHLERLDEEMESSLKTETINPIDLLDELSSDALTIIHLLIHTPKEIINTMGQQSHRGLQASLKRYLKTLEWSQKQIQESFSEIIEAIVN